MTLSEDELGYLVKAHAEILILKIKDVTDHDWEPLEERAKRILELIQGREK